MTRDPRFAPRPGDSVTVIHASGIEEVRKVEHVTDSTVQYGDGHLSLVIGIDAWTRWATADWLTEQEKLERLQSKPASESQTPQTETKA